MVTSIETLKNWTIPVKAIVKVPVRFKGKQRRRMRPSFRPQRRR